MCWKNAFFPLLIVIGFINWSLTYAVSGLIAQRSVHCIDTCSLCICAKMGTGKVFVRRAPSQNQKMGNPILQSMKKK